MMKVRALYASIFIKSIVYSYKFSSCHGDAN
jgi:hypothetical protein